MRKSEFVQTRHGLLPRHQMRNCRHHGLTEFYWSSDKKGGNYRCLQCHREENALGKNGRYGLGPHSKQPGCPNYTGLYIAETVLSKAFSVMEKAHPHAPYDFICGKGYKVDSKCSLLLPNQGKKASRWMFRVIRNKVPDAFCFIALQNTSDTITDSPQIAYVWLIPGDALIEGRPLNDRMGISVSPSTVSKLEPFRRSDMEGKITTCCSTWKNPHLDHEVI